jgi:hypothetical protein
LFPRRFRKLTIREIAWNWMSMYQAGIGLRC